MKRILFFLVFFGGINLFAQEYSFINFGVKEGLAQSQVTDICQDNYGYLWVGTQSGLSRFDGKMFTNYSKIDGLIDNTVQKLYFSPEKNRLWVASPNGISYLDLTTSNQFKSLKFNGAEKINDILFRDDTLFVATNNNLILLVGKDYTYYPNDIRIRALGDNNSKEIICASRNGLYVFANSKITKYQDENIGSYNYSDLFIEGENWYLSTYRNGLIKYNPNSNQKQSLTAESRVLNFIKSDHKIWAISHESILFINDALSKQYTAKNGIPQVKLKCLFLDAEQNLWIGTYGKGLLKFSGESVMRYSTNNGLSSDIVMSISQNSNGAFAFGTYDKGVTILNEKTSLHINGVKNNLPSETVWATEAVQDGFWAATSNGLVEIKNDKVKLFEDLKGKFKSIAKDGEKIYVGGKSGLYVFEKDTFQRVLSGIKFDISKIEVNRDKIYLATKNGVYFGEFDEDAYEFKKISLPEQDCNTLTVDAYNNVWVGTIDGLFLIDPNLMVREYKLDSANFKSRNVLGLITDAQKNVWASTTNGVYFIEKGNYFSNSLKQFHYGEAVGVEDLESNLNAIYQDQLGYVWVGTSSELYRINPHLKNELFQQQLPNLNITSIRLFKEKFNYHKYARAFDSLSYIPTKLILPTKQNHLTFEFNGVNLKNPKNVKYSYRLQGAEENWSPLSSEQSATYSFIAPGEYEFQVKATNDGVNWTNIKSVKIEIQPYFYQRWWFVASAVVSFLLLMYLIIWLRIRSLKRKKDTEQLKNKSRLRELEQQSLNASMNRHFIFNSLNSIQYFINSSDKRSANKFLTNFAKLIRKNLDSSTVDNFMVNLEEEIERISLYLKLEKMRFGDKFDYKINVESDVETEITRVPSMLLQPFVENSIIHGVLPKNGDGMIKITIKNDKDSIVFEVEDNGVGIENSLDLKSDFDGDHISKGMEITENRIELIRKINGGKLMIIGPFQVNNELGESMGTKVIIKLPINGIE